MTTLIFGGGGFVGLNVAERLLAEGRSVLLFDLRVPQVALDAFSSLPGRVEVILGDVTDPAAVRRAVRPGVDAVVLGAAVTADEEREAAEPDLILAVNLMSLPGILKAASEAGVRRTVNLSSGSALGAAATRAELLEEDTPADPVSLYAVSKFASERVLARLGALWRLDFVNLRLSTVFGRWERATGVRDTLSPFLQLMMAAERGEPAILPRPGVRDWIYAADVADAVRAVIDAPALGHTLYNVSTGQVWSVLDWADRLSALRPGFAPRLAEPGERATINLHGPTDRAPLSILRMQEDLGWQARRGLDETVSDLDAWRRKLGHRLAPL
jgi:UDP-glucose 4-epimerase